MPLIAVAPDKATYALTPAQYAGLVEQLKTNPDASGMIETSPNTGTVSYQKIDFAWSYDGSAQLTVNIVGDHNWKARIAGNEAIFQDLDSDLIAKL